MTELPHRDEDQDFEHLLRVARGEAPAEPDQAGRSWFHDCVTMLVIAAVTVFLGPFSFYLNVPLAAIGANLMLSNWSQEKHLGRSIFIVSVIGLVYSGAYIILGGK